MKPKTRKSMIATFAAGLTGTLLLSACGAGAGNHGNASADGSQKIVLSAVSAFGQNEPNMDSFFTLIERLEEEIDNLEIDYRGGPDAMDPMNIAEAVSNGTVDLASNSSNYYEGILPWAATLDLLAPLNPTELRDSGIWDFLNEKHEEGMNFHLLAETTPLLGFQLYINKEIEKVDDIAEHVFRVSPAYTAMLDDIGAKYVMLPSSEIYTAMERGTVQGFGWTSHGAINLGLDEVTKYEILPEFNQSSQPVIVNLDRWQSLPEDMREKITAIVTEMEPEFVEHHRNKTDAERLERTTGSGMKVIEFEGEERAKYLRSATDAKWAEIIGQHPELQEVKDLYDAAMEKYHS